MSENKKKYISDNRSIHKSESLTKFYDTFDIKNLNIILNSQPQLINKKDEKTGWTLLFRAVINNDFSLTEFLLDRDADPNIQNIYGEASLHHAVENSNHKIINLLLEKGANPNIQQIDGETPMHIAAVKGDYKVVKLLNLYGGNVNICTFEYSYTPLDYANERGDKKCIEVIEGLMEKQKSRNVNKRNGTFYNHNNDDRSGSQTTKNSDSPIYRVRNNIGVEETIDPQLLSIYQNNTSKNTNSRNNHSYHQKHISQGQCFPTLDIDKRGEMMNNIYATGVRQKNHYRNNSCINLKSDDHCDQINMDNHHYNYTESDQTPKNSDYNTGFKESTSTFLNQMNNFEERLEKIKKELMENVIASTDVNVNTNGDQDENCKPNNQEKVDMEKHFREEFQINNVEEISENLENTHSHYNIYHTNMDTNPQNNDNDSNLNNTQENPYANSLSSLTSNTPKSSIYHSDYANNFSKKIKHIINREKGNLKREHSKYSANYESSSLPTYLNYANLINSHNNKKLSARSNEQTLSRDREESTRHGGYTLNMEDNRLITLKPEEYTVRGREEICRGDLEEDEQSQNTYITHSVRGESGMLNFKLNRNDNNNNYCRYDSKVNDMFYSDFETGQWTNSYNKVKLSETFDDFNKVLAVFMSTKNDIDENYEKKYIYEENVEGNQKKNENAKFTDLFNFNLDEMNEFIQNTEKNNSEEGEESEESEEEGNFILGTVDDSINNSKNLSYTGTFNNKCGYQYNNDHINNKINSYSPKKNTNLKLKIPNNQLNSNNPNNVKYFSQSNRSIKDEFKQITLDPNTLNEVSVTIYQNGPDSGKNLVSNETLDKMNINFEELRNGSRHVELEYNSTEAIREINSFLKVLDLEKYTYLFIKNGFDDLSLILEQMKCDMAITDQNLKDIGISLPGHRAKIMLKLEEECNNFGFPFPPSVYYTIPEFLNTSTLDFAEDPSVKSLYTWLTNLKMEQFLLNFINSGYHSLELLFIQMNSKNPLTEKNLEEEVGVNKMGYRIRILNKLKDDSRMYMNKLKSKMRLADKKESQQEICKCIIF